MTDLIGLVEFLQQEAADDSTDFASDTTVDDT